MITDEVVAGERIARMFHETYERLAPSFGYATREDTREFDPTSKNGRLMIAVCEAVEPMLRTDDLKALLQDADRYRIIRDLPSPAVEMAVGSLLGEGVCMCQRECLDEAIDAFRSPPPAPTSDDDIRASGLPAPAKGFVLDGLTTKQAASKFVEMGIGMEMLRDICESMGCHLYEDEGRLVIR